MQSLWHKLWIVIFLLLIVTISYQIGRKGNNVEINTIPKQDEGIFNCPYKVMGGVYKEYLSSSDEVEVVGKPQFVDNPQIIKISKPFDKHEFEKNLYKLSTDKGWDSREFDVNGDGDNETIINANIAMNHTPHIALIVDNGNVVFEANGANVWIDKVNGSQGFLLSETVDWNSGERKKTRYIYKDGGFLPVWTQKSCRVSFD